MAEHHSQRVRTQDVVLDIGDDAGALIFHTPPELRGAEIEICPVTEPENKTHTEVVARLLQGTTIFTGVFPPLPIGDYHVCRPRERAGQVIKVASGQVTEVDWR